MLMHCNMMSVCPHWVQQCVRHVIFWQGKDHTVRLVQTNEGLTVHLNVSEVENQELEGDG